MVLTNTRAIVLAAGQSTRFKSDKNKQTIPLCGRPMIVHSLLALQQIAVPITVVVGYQADAVKEVISKAGIKDVTYVIQDKLLGTGDAVIRTKATWDTDHILIINGDAPLITPELLSFLGREHLNKKAVLSFVTTHAVDPTGYGRVIESNGSYKVVEQKECIPDQDAITRINAGMYVIEKAFLLKTIDTLQAHGKSGEFYLPDLIEKASQAGLKVNAVAAAYDDVRGVNNFHELFEVEQIKRYQLIKKLMLNGVYFQLPQTVHIDCDVTIASGTTIGAGVQLFNGTVIGKNCIIEAHSVLRKAVIGDTTHIYSHTVIQDSIIENNVKVGPFARLRDNVHLDEKVTIGNFVEVKKSRIGKGTKAKHLAFLGDAIIEQSVNIGAGTITCNWDGLKKHQTYIQDQVYIGANSSLVAPITIGKGSYTAAGSTITNDVPPGDLAIGRARQVNKAGYVKKIKDRQLHAANAEKTSAMTGGAMVAPKDAALIEEKV